MLQVRTKAGAPGPPRRVSVSHAQGGGATAHWRAPHGAGGSPVTGYELEMALAPSGWGDGGSSGPLEDEGLAWSRWAEVRAEVPACGALGLQICLCQRRRL